MLYSENNLNPLFKTESAIYKRRGKTCYLKKVINTTFLLNYRQTYSFKHPAKKNDLQIWNLGDMPNDKWQTWQIHKHYQKDKE